MANWADFVITKVGYDRTETRIVQVEIRPDTGTSIGQATRATRQQVIDSIGRGVTYVTAYLRNGNWQRGEDVHVATIRGVKYLRTDRNRIEAENLGSLPRMERAAC